MVSRGRVSIVVGRTPLRKWKSPMKRTQEVDRWHGACEPRGKSERTALAEGASRRKCAFNSGKNKTKRRFLICVGLLFNALPSLNFPLYELGNQLRVS